MSTTSRIGSFRALLDLWPQPENAAWLALFAQDLGITPVHAQQMYRRNSVPPGYWQRLMESAARHGIDGVTKELLADLAMARGMERLAS